MNCNDLKSVYIDRTGDWVRSGNDTGKFYLKEEVDAIIVDLQKTNVVLADNERLNNALDKERSETIKYMDELCNAKNEIERLTIEKRNDELRADVADATVEKLKAENEELKQKIEDAKATAYAESVDAGMENRRLKRALWLARAERAADRARIFYFNDLETMLDIDGFSYDSKKKKGCKKLTARLWRIIWEKVERKCRSKAEEYK